MSASWHRGLVEPVEAGKAAITDREHWSSINICARKTERKKDGEVILLKLVTDLF